MIPRMAENPGRPSDSNSALSVLFQHKTWATLSLIEHCRRLAEEELNATTPGTYGSIRATLQHLVRSEEGYFALLTGERLAESSTDEPVALDELADRIRRLGPRWEALAQDPDIHRREVTAPDGWHTVGALILAQAVHHADDHRTHVLSIIGARGLDLPGVDIGQDLDVWHYGIALGLMQKVAPTR